MPDNEPRQADIDTAASDNKVIDMEIGTVFGTGIRSVEQTITSREDDGTNEITVTLTNDTSSTFYVKNGSKGSKGDKGDKGEPGGTSEDVNNEIKRIVSSDQEFLDKITSIVEKKFITSKVGVSVEGTKLKFELMPTDGSTGVTEAERARWNQKATAMVKDETMSIVEGKDNV